ncbi:uncharacterized protein [Lepeophtheirus salmonis]|nr:uncharacterized protein LOC121118640 [Lepeophtheirus salmonis]
MYFLILYLLLAIKTSLARTIPSFDFGDKSREEFLRSAIERSSPGNARLLAELFGGLELGINLGGETKAVISVGGAATRCQHQSPCFDVACGLCYDPLLRIHGRCGGASYYTCRGTLPQYCVPFSCTATPDGRSARQNSESKNDGKDAYGQSKVFVKTFPKGMGAQGVGCRQKQKVEDPGNFEYNSQNQGINARAAPRKGKPKDVSALPKSDLDEPKMPSWALIVPEPVTSCQGDDICVDLRCGRCYDPYLGTHTHCGKMTYFDCATSLHEECQPIRCTDVDIDDIFTDQVSEGKEADTLMVRSFSPMKDTPSKCY